ncbi:MAG: hypothetical protein J6C01_02275 [Lachnospiraceae bacterium]|nr:hypothetical protein [Lachnospiraceae bacterium]
MSQAKVDKRKYEKVHRKEIEKKRKIKTAVICIVVALAIGAFVGVPVGISIYKSIPKFVGDSSLGAFITTYIDDNYSAELESFGTTTEAAETTEAEDEVEQAVEDALGAELESVDVEDLTEE